MIIPHTEFLLLDSTIYHESHLCPPDFRLIIREDNDTFFFRPFRLKIIHSNFGRQSTFLRIDNCSKSGRCLEFSSI